MAKPNGIVFYRGPSMLDGKPIVAILTGLAGKSANEKTGGGLYQTWILREDINPLQAVNTGDDASICGDCRHRGTIVDGRNKGRSCYVRLDTAPNNIFKTYQRGRYPMVSPAEVRFMLTKLVRGGSYGDPAAVPFWVWEAMLDGAPTGTAYTHQWRLFPELAAFCMASVDTSAERAEAKLLGFRTFRVRDENEPIEAYEVVCPASKEAGYKTTCDACRACGGTRAKAKADIVIAVHGSGKAKHFATATEANL
jgi:hypothetical protein